MNELNTTSFTAHIGIDWADSKHDVCVQCPDTGGREFDVIPHKVELRWHHLWSKEEIS